MEAKKQERPRSSERPIFIGRELPVVYAPGIAMKLLGNKRVTVQGRGQKNIGTTVVACEIARSRTMAKYVSITIDSSPNPETKKPVAEITIVLEVE